MACAATSRSVRLAASATLGGAGSDGAAQEDGVYRARQSCIMRRGHDVRNAAWAFVVMQTSKWTDRQWKERHAESRAEPVPTRHDISAVWISKATIRLNTVRVVNEKWGHAAARRQKIRFTHLVRACLEVWAGCATVPNELALTPSDSSECRPEPERRPGEDASDPTRR
jgi:hypothetical protein